MRFSNYNDHDLLLLVKEGNQKAFSELYDRHWGMMYIHAMKMLSDEDQAKDIVQEVFISLWNRSSQISLDSALSTYLFSSVRNKVLNLMRDEKTRTRYIDLFSLYTDEHSNATLARIEERELLQAIEETIQSLPEKMRIVFELSRKSNLSHREIAEKLNISENTVKRQISNAIKILKTKHNRPESLIFALLFLNCH